MASEAELIAAWRQGEREAGRVLFERYYKVLERFFANKIGSDPLDIIQETFLACVAGRDRLRSDQSFRSYLFSIAHNLLKRHYAREQRSEKTLDLSTLSSIDLSPGPSTMIGRCDEQRILLHALRRIPVESQIVLELTYWEGMTSQEIAEALEVPSGTVRTRLRRARALLDQALEKVTNDPELLEATRSGLEGWLTQIRAAHGVAEGGSA